VENEDVLVEQGAMESETKVVKIIPRDKIVWSAEKQGKTVVEAFPDSEMAGEYKDLAAKMLEVMKDAM